MSRRSYSVCQYAGFTLLELLVVVAILVGLFAMLMPAVTPAAACSPSASKCSSPRPLTFFAPAAAASAQPRPIGVDGVIA